MAQHRARRILNDFEGYWQSLGTSFSFLGRELKDCFEVIRIDVVAVWAIDDPHHVRYFFHLCRSF